MNKHGKSCSPLQYQHDFLMYICRYRIKGDCSRYHLYLSLIISCNGTNRRQLLNSSSLLQNYLHRHCFKRLPPSLSLFKRLSVTPFLLRISIYELIIMILNCFVNYVHKTFNCLFLQYILSCTAAYIDLPVFCSNLF